VTTLEITVEKLVYGGDGLARLKSDEQRAQTVFVPFVLPGERVEARVVEQQRGLVRAELQRVVQASEFRTDPACPYFGKCGGCQYQHIDYDAQLRFKSEILRETMRRTAKIDLASEIQFHPSPPLHYRNRTRFHVGHKPQFSIGYFRPGSHELLSVRQCPISSPLINRALEVLWNSGEAGRVPTEIGEVELFANANDEKALGELYLNASSYNRGGLIAFARELATPMPEVQGLVAFPKWHPVGRQDKAPEPDLLFGEKIMKYDVGSETYRISAGAFFQTNRYLLPQMVELVVDDRSGRIALDLYSGVGLFAVPLARRFERVVAVESSRVSAADLRSNVPGNVKVSSQSTEAYLESAAGTLKPDFIVVDPPRAGLGTAVCAQLSKLRAQNMTYVSCDPATLARDLKQLISGGWQISQMHLIDLFPQTFHIETCVMLRR